MYAPLSSFSTCVGGLLANPTVPFIPTVERTKSFTYNMRQTHVNHHPVWAGGKDLQAIGDQ